MPFKTRIRRRKKHLRKGIIGSFLDMLSMRSLQNTADTPIRNRTWSSDESTKLEIKS